MTHGLPEPGPHSPESRPSHGGWTVPNVALGLAFFGVGLFAWIIGSIIALGGNEFFMRFGFGMIALGPLLFWLIIPAYQRWWGRRRILAIIILAPTVTLSILILIALVLPAPAREPTTASARQTQTKDAGGPAAKHAEGGGVAITVHRLQRAATVSGVPHPGEGAIFVVIEVTIENVGHGQMSYNFLQFKLRESRGHEYPSEVLFRRGGLTAGSLVLRERARGELVFKVPGDAQGLVLTYRPDLRNARPLHIPLE